MARGSRYQNASKKRASLEDSRDSPRALFPIPTKQRLRALSNSNEKVNKADRRQLQAQQNDNVRKAEKSIGDSYSSIKAAQARYKRTQLERLSDLVKRRAEIETEIEAQLQSLKELYEDASKAMDMAAAKLSTV